MSNENPPKPKKKKKWGNRPPLHKRQYIVNKPLQYRFIGLLFTIWFANSVFFTIVLYLIFEGHINHFYDLVPKEGIFPLLTIPALLVSAVAFVSVFGIIVIGIMSLFISSQNFVIRRCTFDGLQILDVGGRTLPEVAQHRIEHRGVVDEKIGLPELEVESPIARDHAVHAHLRPVEGVGLARRMRENKEALIGIGTEDATSGGKESEAGSVAVH